MVRDEKLDGLRAVGILCIILAHVGAPNFLYQLRNFDVVLMVFLIGYVYTLTPSRTSYMGYIIKRFKRLIIPTWVFLCILFVILFACGIDITGEMVLHSYVMSDGAKGVGYVWVMRVFFLVALISPILKRIVSIPHKYGTICASYFIYEMIYCAGTRFLTGGIAEYFAGEYIYNLLGYGIICAFGMAWAVSEKKKRKIVYIALVVIFAVCCVYNGFQPTQIAKRPPRIYYISYGLIATCTLFFIAYYSKLGKWLFQNKFLVWIGQNSFWIYLWHIVPIKLITYGIIVMVNYSCNTST